MKVSVERMTESSGRSWWVTLVNAKGQILTPHMFKESAVLSADECRERALFEASEYAAFLGVTMEPYVEDGVVYEPYTQFSIYRD